MEHRALDVLPEAIAIEDRVRAACQVLAEERLPPDAAVDRHAARRPPRVLRIQTLVPLVVIDAGQARLIDRGDASEQHVRQSQTRCLAREVPLAAAARPCPERDAEVRDARAEPELVLAAHHRQVVVHLERVVVGDAPGRRRRGDLETAGDDDNHRARHVGGRLDAERRGIEVRIVVAVDRRTVERKPQRIDRAAAEDLRIA